MKLSFKILYFLSLVFLGGSLLASVELSLDRDEVSLGESFTLSFTAEGGTPEVEKKELDFATVVSQGSSTQVSYVNGAFSKQITYSFVFATLKEGTFTIPSFSVTVGSKKLTTEPLKIKIVPPSSDYKAHKRKRDEAFSDDEEKEKEELSDAFIQRNFSKKEVYVGESILSTINFYYDIKLQNLIPEFTQNKAFRYLDFQPWEGRKEYEGRTYNAVVLRNVLLPIRSGEYRIDRYLLKAEILRRQSRARRSRSIFDDFFGNGYAVENKTFATEEETLLVKAIPNEGRPAGYRGLVGRFDLEASLSDKDVTVGETTTLTITIKGEGSLDSYSAPKLKLPKGIKVYADKPDLKEEISPKKGLISTKTFKFALVPTRDGEFDLGSYEESAFDPKKEAFVSLKAALGSFMAEGTSQDKEALSTGVSSDTGALSPKEKVKALGEDLIDIKRGLRESSEEKEKSSFALLFYLSLLVSALYLLLVLRPYLSFLSFRGSRGIRRENAYKNYKSSKQSLSSGNTSLEAVFSLYKSFLGDKFDLNSSSLTKKELIEALKETKLEESVKEEILKVFGDLERAFFSREVSDPRVGEKILAKVDELVKKVDRYV